MIEEVIGLGMHFIFIAKPGDHKSMFEDIEGLRVIEGVQSYTIEQDGISHYYEWVNDIGLNGNKSTKIVNYFSYKCSKDGKVLYKNSWVTDFAVNKGNIKLLAKAGRGRWKCENEGFNSLKNQGYHIDHNYGHGNKNLAFNNYILNLLSFFLHKFCELKDKTFKKCYDKLGSKALIWQKVRDYSEVMIFDSFAKIFEFMANPVPVCCAIPPPC